MTVLLEQTETKPRGTSTMRAAVFHGVNNRFTIFWDRFWKDGERRESKLVFIGKGLKREAIEPQLLDCTR